MALIPGAIPVTGFIGPTDSTDTYAVTDALYGIDGLRNVEDNTERNAITAERRRKGMIVGTKVDGKYWKLIIDSPWAFDDTDWELFIDSGSGPITPGLWENIGGNIVTSSTMFSPGPPNVLPYFDDQQDLGSKLSRWKDLYLGSKVDFDSVLTFVVGAGSPDDTVLRVDTAGLAVYPGKLIYSDSSPNTIDLDQYGLGGFGISTDNNLYSNNKFFFMNSTNMQLVWSDGITLGMLAADNTQLGLFYQQGFISAGINFGNAEIFITHNTRAYFNTDVVIASGRSIMDTGMVSSIETNARFLLDGFGVSSIAWNNRIAYDGAGTDSVQWDGRVLADSAAGPSVSWGSRLLVDSLGVNSIDWQNHLAYDGGPILSMDWATRRLHDGGGTIVVDWGSNSLYDSAGTLALSWIGRVAYDTTGTQVAIQWDQRRLYDETNTPTLRWSSAEIHLYSSALTGTAMNGINLDVAGAPVIIVGDTGLTFQSSTGYGFNVDASNFTTLNGADMAITSDDNLTITFGNGGTIKDNSNAIEATAVGGAQISLDYQDIPGLVVISTDAGALATNNYFQMYGGPGSQTAIWWTDNGSNYGNISFDDVSGARFNFNGSVLILDTTGKGLYTSGDGAGLQYDIDYSGGYTNRSLVDKAYADATFVNNHKYVFSGALTGGTLVTITHGLGSTDVICDVISTTTGQKVWGARVENYTTNSIDVTVSVSANYKVVIIG